MFTKGIEKTAKAPTGVLQSVTQAAKKAGDTAKPYVKGALHHLQTKPALHGAAAGALGGAATGAMGRDEYGQRAGMAGAIKGAITGGVAGAAGGATYNRMKKGPAKPTAAPAAKA